MENRPTKRLRCPECLNYVIFTQDKNGGLRGKCSVCGSIISSVQHSPREKRIRVVKP